MTSTTIDRRIGVNSQKAMKVPVKAASSSNVTLSGEQTIDGVSCVTGDRVLLWGQTDGTENGIWDVDTSSWTRALDFDDVNDVSEGTWIPVNQGTNYAGRSFRVTTTGTITPGTTSLALALAQEYGVNYPTLVGETGVTNLEYEYGDVRRYGAVGDNSTNNNTAISNAISSAPSTNNQVYFPAGTYLTTSTLTVSESLRIYGDGLPSLVRCTGSSANVFHFDGSAETNQLSGLLLHDLTLATESGGSDVIKLTHMGRGRISNIYIPSSGGVGIKSLGSAYMTYVGVVISQNLDYTVGTRQIPSGGVSLEVNGVTSISSGHNTFISLEVEDASTGTGIGINIDDYSSHNVFYNGNSVNCKYGLVLGANAGLNHFYGLIMENNTTLDVQNSGYYNTFVGVQAYSTSTAGGIQCLTGADNNIILGGRFRNVTIDSGCTGTVLDGGLSIHTGVTDNGTATQIGVVWDMDVNKYLPQKTTLPSAAASGGGMKQVRDAANNNRQFIYGLDNTVFTNGVAYIQAILSGTGYIPLMLQPGGGIASIGPISADPGGSACLAMSPATAPSNNHTGITFYSDDGLNLKFMDKNGVTRTVTHT